MKSKRLLPFGARALGFGCGVLRFGITQHRRIVWKAGWRGGILEGVGANENSASRAARLARRQGAGFYETANGRLGDAGHRGKLVDRQVFSFR